jgi:ribonuclease HI
VGVEGNELADRMSILAIEKQDTDFVRYAEEVNISDILSIRAG